MLLRSINSTGNGGLNGFFIFEINSNVMELFICGIQYIEPIFLNAKFHQILEKKNAIMKNLSIRFTYKPPLITANNSN